MTDPLFIFVSIFMKRTIIIGYGNIHRTDDGAAYEIINAVRNLLGQKALNEDETGLENLGGRIDSVFLPQLTPEIIEILVAYDMVVFVDAHVGASKNDIDCSEIRPENSYSTFTHHMTPSMLLAFLHVLYQHDPTGYMVSVKGHDFDFKRELSARTGELVHPTSEKIFRVLQDQSMTLTENKCGEV